MYGIYQLNTKYISQIGERSFNCWSVLANLADTPSKNLSTDTRLSIVYGPSLIANWILFWQPRYFKLKNQVPSQVQIEIGHRTDKAKDKEKERSLFRAPVKWSNYTDYPLLKPTSIGGNANTPQVKKPPKRRGTILISPKIMKPKPVKTRKGRKGKKNKTILYIIIFT